jgi:predicted LPLAT superfamily acyltransferase
LIPTYDNPDTVDDVVRRVQEHVADVIVVDDGSHEPARTRLLQIAEWPRVTVVRREANGGKGSAVKAGLARAQQLGFSHALQVDADGQHEIERASELLDLARRDPSALVLARPVFAADAPRARLIGRKLTQFWTHVETLGAVIGDPMCGFRVYPVARALAAAARGNRMDFDPEIAVRMVWNGTPVLELPTRVRYFAPDQGGVSHFRLVRDNLLISWMHTRLVCGALLRLLRGQRVTPRVWHEAPEVGSGLGIAIVGLTARLLGRRAARALLLPIVFYYALFARAARAASRQYLSRMGLPRGFGAVYRHFLRFAQCALDRWFLLAGRTEAFEFSMQGNEHLFRLAHERRGAILLGAHLGNFDAGRVMAKQEGLAIHVLGMFDRRARLNRELDRAGDNQTSRYVAVTPGEPSYLFRVKELIERGDSIALLGDRCLDERGELVEFLGAPARFPVGPYALAAALQCPVYIVMTLYESPNRYRLHCEPFLERVPKRRDDPAAHKEAARAFARRLEHYCRAAPDNWFNFFEFWEAPE